MIEKMPPLRSYLPGSPASWFSFSLGGAAISYTAKPIDMVKSCRVSFGKEKSNTPKAIISRNVEKHNRPEYTNYARTTHRENLQEARAGYSPENEKRAV